MLSGEDSVASVVAAIEAKLIKDGVMELGAPAAQARK
jgi:hypothetical protein